MIVREVVGGERVWLNNDYRYINVRLYLDYKLGINIVRFYLDYKLGINIFCLFVIICILIYFVFGKF